MSDNHLLAINTVTGSCSVAISKGVNLLTQKSILENKGYSEIMIPLIEAALAEVKLEINQLDGFLVCTGPGNYTNLRVATSTARGLALACNTPTCGITLFELFSGPKYKTLVLVKGPEEKFYVQKFSNGVAMAAPQLMTLNEIQSKKEFLDLNTAGYQAKKVGALLGSKESVELDDISFKKFVTLGLTKLKSTNPRPAPIYIK